ncbi:autotransporter outer membrane beta-barrel domain-containing protein [Escherichia coli O88:H1]|nr:autotransporter outer membrane beta-barrel domain-containing protein [Escherichia coli O88:H1]EJG7501936.1 autotransporter outer membrane beta-barrel domain-containing protein [Escherichia coli]
MNKIYSLKYSHITGGLVAVSELTRKVTSRAKKLVTTIIILSGSAVLSPVISADLNINKVWARDYLDLAQNNGIFKAGATNITLQLKDGSTLKFPEVAIPDFSPASNKGATTSIGGAYSVTAAHNGTSHHAIATQSWGQTDYTAINRMTSGDFAVQRLNKYVVETTGMTDYVDFSLSAQEALERYGILYNGTRQIVGFRAGSGSTYTNTNGSQYSTGQAYNPLLLSASMFTINWNNYNRAYNNQNGFYNESTTGDSGSGYYLFDNKLQKWVIAGVHGGVGISNKQVVWAYYTPYSNELVNNLKEYFTQKIHLNGQEAKISQNTININDTSVNIEKNKNNQNKDLYFYGGGKITLNDNLALGYGGFVFDENKNYSITGGGNITSSAGIDIGNGTTVDWNIQYTSDDSLHKIGEGTLDIKKAQNTNLKIGNGTVILNAEKTFNNIYMASGNGTIKLNHDKALGTGEFQGIFFTENGGTLDLNGHSQTFQRIAATDAGTTITNTSGTEAILAINNSSNYIFHGNVQDNIKLTHEFDSKKDNSRLIIDGDINTKNDISVKNSQLTLQGHATDHAVFREGSPVCHWGLLCDKDYAGDIQKQEATANKNNNTNYKTNNQVASFEQPDWDNRTFQFRRLTLENASFSVGRNALVKGDIVATNSDITLGDNQAYIDLYSGKNITGSGFSFRQQISSGVSVGETVFSGQIISEGGSVKVNNQASVTLTKSSSLNDTSLTIDKGGVLTAQGGLFSSKEAQIAGTLNLTGTQSQNNTWSPAIYLGYGDYNLTADNALFTARNQASVTADIKSDKTATLSLGQETTTGNQDLPVYSAFALAALNGFDTSLTGKISAPASMLIMNNALWNITGDSSLKKISMAGSMVRFNNENRNSFNMLTVDELTINNSAFVMRTNTQQADLLIVKNKLEGEKNLLLVDFIEKKGNDTGLNIDLVKAPKNTSKDVFKTETQTIGFSDVTPEIKQQDKEGQSVWTLTGYQTVANATATAKATSLMSGNYKTFLNEVNNLNKRMGDLRDINGEAGAWARIMSGAGSAGGGYSDNYTHVQIGADKKHELDGLDLFTGMTMTYTDSNAGNNDFSGKTKSVGGGLYASAMFESGAYIDLIGKYVHHDNEYTASFASLGTKNYSSHSWYAGAEVGWRYHVTPDSWIEPQAELVYGAVSGKQFAWKDQGMSLSMKDKDFNPLIGRTGVDIGKTFSGKDWKVTARAGLGYQFDILANSETVLRDASGEKRIKGEKDGRMLMNVGLNAEIRDNLRFGLEFEKSAFGKYNVDNAVNANFRYSF